MENASVLKGRKAGLAVTPHSGEMAKFLGISRCQVEDDPVECAQKASRELNAVVAIKGAVTHVVSRDGTVACCRGGSIALATSGSGDTLAGILVGLLARGTEPPLATE